MLHLLGQVVMKNQTITGVPMYCAAASTFDLVHAPLSTVNTLQLAIICKCSSQSMQQLH
jgi:hypothetical protein